MNTSKKLLTIGIGWLALISISAISWADNLPCENNFTVKDGFFDRKVYKTWQDFEARTLTTQIVLQRAYVFLVKDGWIINSTDKEAGVISASLQEGTLGEGGRVASLSILTEGSNSYFGGKAGGTRVTTIFSVPAGLHAQEDRVRNNFCDILAYIKQY